MPPVYFVVILMANQLHYETLFFLLVQGKRFRVRERNVLSFFPNTVVYFQTGQLHCRVLAKERVASIRHAFVVGTEFTARQFGVRLTERNNQRVGSKLGSVFGFIDYDLRMVPFQKV